MTNIEIRSIICGHWIEYDFTDLGKRPKETGSYLIGRKDGKIHWERWNGSGWAYNNNEIRYFMYIPELPIKTKPY